MTNIKRATLLQINDEIKVAFTRKCFYGPAIKRRKQLLVLLDTKICHCVQNYCYLSWVRFHVGQVGNGDIYGSSPSRYFCAKTCKLTS